MADFERLYTEYRGVIFKYLMTLCRDGELAEELTQETFFRGYINMAKLKDESRAVPWLYRIARNLYYAWWNEHKKLTSLEDHAHLPARVDVTEAVETSSLSHEAMRHLRELEEPYKEVFTLSVFGEVSLKDISLLYGKSESWARVTFYRAKQKIIEKMR